MRAKLTAPAPDMRRTQYGIVIGTPAYMSPEQCRGEKIDGRSDIYALGVQFFELLTGKVPYKAENTAGIILKHIQDPVPRLPLELCQYQPLLDKMMAKDKEMRIAGGAELVKFIDGFHMAQDHQLMPHIPTTTTASVTKLEIPTMEQLTIPTPQPATPISFLRQSERKKWLTPALLGVAAVVAVGTTIYFFTQSTPGKTEKSTQTAEQKIEAVAKIGAEKKNATPKKTSERGSGEEKKKETGIESPTRTEKQKDSQDRNQQPTPTPDAKNSINTGAMKDGVKDVETMAKPGKSVESTIPADAGKQSPTKVEQTPKATPKNETSVPSLQIKNATLLDLHSDVRREYNSIMERLQIPILNPNLKIMGQIVVNLTIDENGKITIQTFQDMIKVIPILQENQVKIAISRKINSISLPPPKNKNGESVKVSNWRVTFKVGKFLNKIILTKQN